MSDSAKDGKEPYQYTMTLFDTKPEILKKPVQAVHMAITGGVQNKTQRLAFNAMLKNAHNWHAKNPDQSRDVYEISRSELMSMIDYTSPNRKHLKDALRQMQKMTVEWDLLKQDGQSVWQSTVLLPEIGFDRETIYYSYSPGIKPMLFDPTTWARLDLRIQRSFRLDAAAALYEWCNRFRNNPSKRTNEMSWEEWRWVIYGAIDETSILKEYKIFKREKLKPALLEINAISDLEVEMLEIKEGGRRIKNLQFIVTEKKHFHLIDADDSISKEWDAKLKEMKIPSKDRLRVLSNYKLDVIEAHYRYTMTRVARPGQEKIANVGRYFLNALHNGYANDLVIDEPVPVPELDPLKTLQQAYSADRNKEASTMFAEMDDAEKEALLAEYNAVQTDAITKVPETRSKRSARLMIPFYSWLAIRTWSAPTTEDLLKYGLEHGVLSMNK